jgi:hypothetical protein
VWIRRLSAQLLEDLQVPETGSAHAVVGNPVQIRDPGETDGLKVSLSKEEGDLLEDLAVTSDGVVETRRVDQKDPFTVLELVEVRLNFGCV